MQLNYEPNLGEILFEVGKDFLYKVRKGFFYNFLTSAVSLNLLPYFIPITKKEMKESIKFSERDIGTIFGVGIGTLGLICQGDFYLENPKYLAVLFITNLFSGFYERGKRRMLR